MNRRPSAAPAFFALVLWAVGSKAAHAVRTAWAAKTTDPLTKVQGITPQLAAEFGADRWWHLSFHRYDVLTGIGLVLLVLLMVAYRRAGRQTERFGEEHGSARWGTRRDIAPFLPKKGEDGTRFTTTESLSFNTHRTKRNRNVFVLGGAGTGKSRRFVIPNLLADTATSKAISDSKGELLRLTGSELEAQGYEVRVLNLVDLRNSDAFNPLEYVDPDQPEVDLSIIAAGIVANTTGKRPEAAGDFWERAELALLTSLMAYVYFTANADAGPGEQDTPAEGENGEAPAAQSASENEESDEDVLPPSLVAVADLARELEASEEDEGFLSPVDVRMQGVREVLAEWEDLPGMTHEESEQIRNGLRFAVDTYRIFEQAAAETRKGVIISLGVRLSILAVSDVRRVMERDTLALDDLGNRRGAVFVVLPDTHSTFTFISALFWRALFTTGVYLADHSPEGRTPVGIDCVLDEFPNIGRIPDFEKIIATIRSREISATVIVQNLAQLKAMFKDSWETITGNCDSTLFLGGSEDTTVEWMSKAIGSGTLLVEESSLSTGSNGSFSRSLRKVKRELMTPDELKRLGTDECIYLLRGAPAFKSRKLPVWTGQARKAA